jgi:hypothetical protein
VDNNSHVDDGNNKGAYVMKLRWFVS